MGGGGAHRKLSDAGDQRVRKRLLDARAFPQLAPYSSMCAAMNS